MDITQARTFLAIVEEGSFVAASKALGVTQSTVSARVRQFELLLGKSLFIRTKASCTLTAAGDQFYRFARTLVQVWEEARHQIAVPAGFSETLIVGGEDSLWQRFLLRLLPFLQTDLPHVALRAEAGKPAWLMRELIQGAMDIAVMYRPELRPRLIVEQLMADQLILLTAAPAQPYTENYVFLEWGDEFRKWHSASFEHMHNPGTSLNLGPLGINYLLNERASGFLPERLATPHIKAGLLHKVEKVPAYDYPVYMVWQTEFSDSETMTIVLNRLRNIAKLAEAGQLPSPYWQPIPDSQRVIQHPTGSLLP